MLSITCQTASKWTTESSICPSDSILFFPSILLNYSTIQKACFEMGPSLIHDRQKWSTSNYYTTRKLSPRKFTSSLLSGLASSCSGESSEACSSSLKGSSDCRDEDSSKPTGMECVFQTIWLICCFLPESKFK